MHLRNKGRPGHASDRIDLSTHTQQQLQPPTCPPVGYEGLTDLLLLCTGFVIWRAFDNTLQGLAMSILTAVGGPAIEVVLINGLGLYSYSHPQVGAQLAALCSLIMTLTIVGVCIDDHEHKTDQLMSLRSFSV